MSVEKRAVSSFQTEVISFNALQWLIKCSLFLAMFTFVDTEIIKSPTILLHHFFMVLLLPYLILRHKVIPKYLIILATVFLAMGVKGIAEGNNSYSLLFKSFIGIAVTFLFYFYVLREFSFDPSKLFEIYIIGVLISAYIFLLQFAFYKVGVPTTFFDYLGLHYIIDKDSGWFIPIAFMSEPAQLATIFSPAMFVAIHNLLLRKKHLIGYLSSIVIVIVFILSTSSTGYMALFGSFVVIAISYRALPILLASFFIGVTGFYFIYLNSEKFKLRLDDSANVFVRGEMSNENIREFNGSTLTLYHHVLISSENFKDHPILGTGLGSHSIAHGKYSPFDERMWWYELNREDGNSLFLRLMSETGLMGLFLMFFFLFRFNLSRRKSVSIENWLISSAILVFMIPVLLRQGNYMANGLPFFMLLYYYVHKNNMQGFY